MQLVSHLSLGFWGFPVSRRAVVERPRLLMTDSPLPSSGERNGAQAMLLAAMARGEKSALSGLYDQLSGPIYSLAHRMLGDTGEAEDLVQDIFLQVWRTASTYDTSRGSVFSWMATLTRNRAIDRIRMRKRRAEILASTAPEHQPAALNGESDSADTLWLREKAAAVRAALADLAPDQQQAIKLAYFSGLTQQEIADQLNEPLGTIKARIRRGLLRLKDRLPARL